MGFLYQDFKKSSSADEQAASSQYNTYAELYDMPPSIVTVTSTQHPSDYSTIWTQPIIGKGSSRPITQYEGPNLASGYQSVLIKPNIGSVGRPLTESIAPNLHDLGNGSAPNGHYGEISSTKGLDYNSGAFEPQLFTTC